MFRQMFGKISERSHLYGHEDWCYMTFQLNKTSHYFIICSLQLKHYRCDDSKRYSTQVHNSAKSIHWKEDRRNAAELRPVSSDNKGIFSPV